MRRPRIRRRWIAVIAAGALGAGTTVAFAATLGVGSWHLWAGADNLSLGVCTLTGSTTTSDTYVNQSSSGSNYSSATTMAVHPNSGSQEWAFVWFNVASCGIPTTGAADAATLVFVASGVPSPSRTLTLQPVTSSFTFSSVTWNNAQSLTYGTPTESFATPASAGSGVGFYVTQNVDNWIKGTANYGWRISDGGSNTGTTATFYTSNSASNQPQLQIIWTKP